MNKNNKKFLTRYTKRVLCELGVLYLKTQARHPLLLEQEVKNFLYKHPGVTHKIFGYRGFDGLTASEIRNWIIYELMHADCA